MNVSNTPSNARALYTAPDGGKIYGSGIHTKEDFMELMMANRPSPEKLRYNGSKERVPMTNDQVTELAKKYETPETVKFINGILGSFSRQELAE